MRYLLMLASALALLSPLSARADWTAQLAGNQDLYDLWGSSPNDLYAVGAAGAIYHSTDSGKTWKPEQSGVTEPLYSVWGSGPDNVYAAGDNGTILRSTDRGKTWRALPNPQLVALRSVEGFSANDIYLVGDNGTILHSTDGDNFTPHTSGTTSALQSLWGADGAQVYVVGDNGTILHSSNSGKTWTPQTSGTNEILRGIWGIRQASTTSIFAVGYHTTILHSIDEGKTWQTIQTGGAEWLGSIWGVSHAGSVSHTGSASHTDNTSTFDIFAVGAKGLLLRSQDGGKTFTPEKTNNTNPLYAVWGTSERLVRIVGRSGALLRLSLPNPVLTVDALTPGTRYIKIDNVEYPAATITLQLEPGSHTVTIVNESDLYEVRTETITLQEGETRPLRWENERVKTYVVIVNNPPGVTGADVTFDEKPVGKTPLQIQGVRKGKHKLLLRAKDFDDALQILEITDNSPTIEPKMKKTTKIPTFALPNNLKKEGIAAASLGGAFWAASSGIFLYNRYLVAPEPFVGDTTNTTNNATEALNKRKLFGQTFAVAGDVFVGLAVTAFVARKLIQRRMDDKQPPPRETTPPPAARAASF